MSTCLNPKFTPNKSKYIERYINTKVDIEVTIPFGFISSTSKDGDTYIYTHGKRNIEQNLPFKRDTIYRMASQSKFMGSVGFLKLVDKGLVDWNTPLKKYLPEYDSANMGVISNYTPKGYIKTIMNPLYTTEGSNVVHVRNHNHPFKDGDYVSLEWSNGSLDPARMKLPLINGIPGFEMYNVFPVRNVTDHGYDVLTTTEAENTGITGGFVKIRYVEPGTYRSLCFSPDKILINPAIKTHYYKMEPLKRDLTILDVLNHGLGWNYYSSTMLYMSFGYASNPIKRDIQAGVWNELGLPVGIPLSCYKCGIREWVRLASRIPLLYQPGEDWSYGPQLCILGALIEMITNKPVEQYMREELWDPLGMVDTGFFIHNEDPQYQDKKSRVSQLYVNMPKIVMKFMGEDILDKFPPIYEAQVCMYEGPRSLCLMDSGMYTTVNDYMKFMKMFLNQGFSERGAVILSENMIKIISTYHTCYDVSNLGTVSSYSSNLSVGIGNINSEIRRKRLLSSIRWGLGVGTMEGCKNHDDPNSEERSITWAGVLGTRFLIDFCAGIAYNVGTNVIGPPAGTLDSDLVELMYKPMGKSDYDLILSDLLL